MSFFLNPALLGLLSFLAVPIIILFFINRKKIILHWAAFEWMKKAQIVKRKSVKTDQWLKLISKLLLILFIVLFVSRPVLKSEKIGKTLFIVDETLSMEAIQDGKSRRSLAQDALSEMISQGMSDYSLMKFSGRLTEISSPGAAMPSPSAPTKGAFDESPGAAGQKEFFDAILKDPIVQKSDSVVFISDFQKAFWSDPDEIASNVKRFGKKTRLIFKPIPLSDKVPNISLNSLSIPPEGYFPGNESRVIAAVRNCSSSQEDSIPVTLEVNGEKADLAYVSLAPFETKTVSLIFRPKDSGIQALTASLPSDSLDADNRIYATINPPLGLKMLSVSPEKGSKDFGYDVFFCVAVKSFCPKDFISVNSVSPLQFLAEDTDSCDFLLVSGLPIPADSPLTRQISQFIKAGNGSLLLFFMPGSDVSFFESLGLKPSPPLIGECKIDPERSSGTYASFLQDGELDISLPTFFKLSVFQGISDCEKGGRLFLKGVQDSPVCVSNSGGTRIISFGLPFYPSYTDFFYNPNFVQFTMRVMNEALKRRMFFSFVGEETRAMNFDGIAPDRDYFVSVAGEDSKEKLQIQNENGLMFLSRPPMGRAGFYSIYCDNAKFADFGYNLTRKDSLLDPVPPANFEKAIESGLKLAGRDASSKLFEGVKEFFPACIVFLILALIFESYAHFWRKT